MSNKTSVRWMAAAMALGMMGATTVRAEIAVTSGQKIAFLGDSITQGGVGPQGYVTLVIRGLEANGVKATAIHQRPQVQ